MSVSIKKIDAKGIHGRFDFRMEFKPGTNIIFGKNGAGKTTLLHILANALSGDFERFLHLQFKSIDLLLSNEIKLSITTLNGRSENGVRVRQDRKLIYDSTRPEYSSRLMTPQEIDLYLRSRSELDDESKAILYHTLINPREQTQAKPVLPIAYFPAFRTMIEAWMAAESKKGVETRRRIPTSAWLNIATERARDWFGGFTPRVNFPSLIDIEDQLAFEIDRARNAVWLTDQTLLSEAFRQILGALSGSPVDTGNPVDVLNEIRDLFSSLEKSPLRLESRIDYGMLQELMLKKNFDSPDNTALRILNIYKETLTQTLVAQNQYFGGIRKYLSSVNEFLDGKEIIFKQVVSVPASRMKPIAIKFEDGSQTDSLRTLSSGERQIVTLVYAATHMNQQEVVLIDEPEISLHIDWQRMLIKRMEAQIGDRQIITCTHSPVIGADHYEKMSELLFKPTKEKIVEQTEDEEEIPL